MSRHRREDAVTRGRRDPLRAARDPRLAEAVRRLWAIDPRLSARGPGPAWLWPVAIAAAFVLGAALAIDAPRTIELTGLVMLAPFAGATLLRLLAAAEVARGLPPRASAVARPRGPSHDGAWPSYTVMVPLYDEAAVLPHLLASLAALEYPASRLAILIVLEERDLPTLRAAAALAMPPHMRIVVVPPGGPRTKPKALNYALTFAASDLVVVFDAEDRPERDQLLIAADVFRRAPWDLACVQARLNIYNARQSFFTRGIMAQTPLEVML